MKIILALFIFSTTLVSHAQQAYVSDRIACDNGSAVNFDALIIPSSSVNVEYYLEIKSQEKDGIELVKKQASEGGVVIVQRYSLVEHGIDGDNWSFFAFSVEAAEFFYVLLSFDGLQIKSIYTPDTDFQTCGGGMVVTYLRSI